MEEGREDLVSRALDQRGKRVVLNWGEGLGAMQAIDALSRAFGWYSTKLVDFPYHTISSPGPLPRTNLNLNLILLGCWRVIGKPFKLYFPFWCHTLICTVPSFP